MQHRTNLRLVILLLSRKCRDFGSPPNCCSSGWFFLPIGNSLLHYLSGYLTSEAMRVFIPICGECSRFLFPWSLMSSLQFTGWKIRAPDYPTFLTCGEPDISILQRHQISPERGLTGIRKSVSPGVQYGLRTRRRKISLSRSSRERESTLKLNCRRSYFVTRMNNGKKPLER